MLHILKFISLLLGVLNINLAVSQSYFPNSELFLQTYPLWHLIISDNHVFDSFPLISASNCRHPAIQQRQSKDGLTVILFKTHTTIYVELHRSHIYGCKTIIIEYVPSIVFGENY
jgi:hypothetical protein